MIDCENGCANGACRKPTGNDATTNVYMCEDSDGGLNFYVPGTTTHGWINSGGGPTAFSADYCTDGDGTAYYTVRDWYCENGYVAGYEEYTCPHNAKYDTVGTSECYCICIQDSECPSGYSCNNGMCTQVQQCTENWQCGSWSTCANNQQTRTCTDSNSCGTTTNKPSTSKSCTIQQQEQEQNIIPTTKSYIRNKEVSVERNVEGKNIIAIEEKTIETSLDVIEESERIYVKTSEGNKEVKILPEEAISKAQKIEMIEKVEIEEEGGKAVYSISGTKRAKLFFIFSVLAEVEQKINVEDGSVVSTKKPLWHFLALGV